MQIITLICSKNYNICRPTLSSIPLQFTYINTRGDLLRYYIGRFSFLKVPLILNRASIFQMAYNFILFLKKIKNKSTQMSNC
jgi:hypothetical protein